MVESRWKLVAPFDDKKSWYECSCGKMCKLVNDYNIKTGVSNSCGCLISEAALKGRTKDLTGKTLGKIHVIDKAESHTYIDTKGKKRSRSMWNVYCECNPDHVYQVLGESLNSGVESCRSCCALSGNEHPNFKHGLTDKQGTLYGKWKHMRERCSDLNDPYYGGKGIKVEEPWNSDLLAFQEWFMSELIKKGVTKYNSKWTIERKDIDKNYSPENCEVMHTSLQNRNKSNTVWVDVFGETNLCLIEAVEKYSIVKESTVRYRMRTNWDLERAMMEPALLGGLKPTNYGTKPTDVEKLAHINKLQERKSNAKA